MSNYPTLKDIYARSLEQEARDNFYMRQKYSVSQKDWDKGVSALKQFAQDLAKKRKDDLRLEKELALELGRKRLERMKA